MRALGQGRRSQYTVVRTHRVQSDFALKKTANNTRIASDWAHLRARGVLARCPRLPPPPLGASPRRWTTSRRWRRSARGRTGWCTRPATASRTRSWRSKESGWSKRRRACRPPRFGRYRFSRSSSTRTSSGTYGSFEPSRAEPNAGKPFLRNHRAGDTPVEPTDRASS